MSHVNVARDGALNHGCKTNRNLEARKTQTSSQVLFGTTLGQI